MRVRFRALGGLFWPSDRAQGALRLTRKRPLWARGNGKRGRRGARGNEEKSARFSLHPLSFACPLGARALLLRPSDLARFKRASLSEAAPFLGERKREREREENATRRGNGRKRGAPLLNPLSLHPSVLTSSLPPSSLFSPFLASSTTTASSSRTRPWPATSSAPSTSTSSGSSILS